MASKKEPQVARSSHEAGTMSRLLRLTGGFYSYLFGEFPLGVDVKGGTMGVSF